MQRALSLNDGEPFDVTHIDGDHTYDNAESDFKWALANTRKLIAMHDVNSRGNPSIENRQLWNDIVEAGKHRTFTISGTREGAWGIGVVWV
jgi:hypothetical protein